MDTATPSGRTQDEATGQTFLLNPLASPSAMESA
jgi:hypothetical protein